jgi:hypothetical protein
VKPGIRPLASAPGYGVSADGQAWSVRQSVSGEWKPLRTSVDAQGYARVSVYVGGRVRRLKVHRLVAESFIGPIPAGFTVNHKSAVKTENAASNLEIVTQGENVRHAHRLGLIPAIPNPNASKTHCPAGHLYSEANTYTYRGMRMCRTCGSNRKRAARASKEVAK